jgi:hypothetical protein
MRLASAVGTVAAVMVVVVVVVVLLLLLQLLLLLLETVVPIFDLSSSSCLPINFSELGNVLK